MVDFVQWARRNHALLLRRARQSLPGNSRLPAIGTAAANLLGCLRPNHSTDERRYYGNLHALVVERYRAPCSEETRLLDGVWRSVSTTLLAELEDADAAPPVVPGAGVSMPGAKRPNVGDDDAVHPSRCVSRRLDAGSKAPAGVEGQARNRVDCVCNASALADTYFETPVSYTHLRAHET